MGDAAQLPATPPATPPDDLSSTTGGNSGLLMLVVIASIAVVALVGWRLRTIRWWRLRTQQMKVLDEIEMEFVNDDADMFADMEDEHEMDLPPSSSRYAPAHQKALSARAASFHWLSRAPCAALAHCSRANFSPASRSRVVRPQEHIHLGQPSGRAQRTFVAQRRGAEHFGPWTSILLCA